MFRILCDPSLGSVCAWCTRHTHTTGPKYHAAKHRLCTQKYHK